MNNDVSAHVLRGASYAQTLAHSLMYYAETHETFLHWLLAYIDTIPHVFAEEIVAEAFPYSAHGCRLDNDETATRRTLWLVDTCIGQRMPQARGTLASLQRWAEKHPREDPSSFIVLGLSIGILPVGLFGEIKRKHDPMAVVLREDVAELGTTGLARSVTALTHGVVEQGLIMAGGHTAKLEPELGDWLFGDRTIALYSATRTDIASIASQVQTLGIPHAVERDARGVTQIALSPAIRVLDLAESSALRSLS